MSDIHGEIRSLLAAYVMDAVPAEEIPAIRAHILSCEECFEEAESYAETLSTLAASIDPVPLPVGFADRVVAAAVGAPEQETSPQTVPRANGIRLPWWRRVALPAGAALAAVVVAVTGVSLVNSVQREREYRRIVAALIQEEGALHLEGPGGAAAVIAPTDGGSTLVALDLGEAPEGSDYQLWLMKDGVPTPSETFDVSGSIVIVDAEEPLDSFDGAAITVEPDGGSTQPTTEPVLST